MARFKKSRAFARRVSGFARKSYRKSSRRSGGSGMLGGIIQPDSMAYGAVRAPIANNLVKMLPGEHPLKDELCMGVVSWAAAKWAPGFFKQMGNRGLTVENARVGEYGGQVLLGGLLGGSSTTGASGPLYG